MMMEPLYPEIAKSYKSLFPFKVGTTSYIYPAPILPNVVKLAPFLDEIELVLFESSGQENLPDPSQIQRLKKLSTDWDVRYNVHLPIDIYLGDPRREVRTEGVRIVTKFIERTLPLSPSVYTLHYSLKDDEGNDAPDLERWKTCLIQSTREILRCGIEPSRMSIETLGYPFEWIENIVKDFECSVCLDIGHLLLQNSDPKNYLEKYLRDSSVVHLHGVQDGVDHLGIDRLSEATNDLILSYLRHYRGILSIEVFSFDELRSSLHVLEERWERGSF
jgi:sugar phosphate isomerase/epimerase